MNIEKRLSNVSVKAVTKGVYNFNTNNKKAIETAEKRLLENCLSCIHFVEEPIDVLKVNDKLIPLLTGKMCGDCGCTLSYKLRQSIVKCKLWNL